MELNLQNVSEQLAGEALKVGAIRLRPQDPFTWASGYRMPIYNDNRTLYSPYANRKLIVSAFAQLIESGQISVDIIAGTSTAGISPGTSLADRLEKPFIYIRDKPKDHGLRNQIEGIAADDDLDGRVVLVIEDLISTGGSSAAAVQAVRDAKGQVSYCFSIFSYGFEESRKMFAGEVPFKEGRSLDPSCEVHSLFTYETLLRVAQKEGYIQAEDIKTLTAWRADPFGWGEKHGFPKVEKR